MARLRQLDALSGAAEGVRMIAKDAGAAINLPKGVEAVTVLEKALAMAWVDVFNFQGTGPNNDPARLRECILQAQRRIGEEIMLQSHERRGHKPS